MSQQVSDSLADGTLRHDGILLVQSPCLQSADDGVCQFLTQLCTALVARTFLIGDGLHTVYQANLFDAVLGPFPVMVQCTVKIPAAVCPAAQDHYPVELVQQVIYRISVHSECTFKVLEEFECYLLSARALMVMEEYQGLEYRSDEPHVAFDRPVLLIVDDRHRTLVGLEVVQLEHVFL